MPNGTYGGVRGKETKAGQKAFVSRPTRLGREVIRKLYIRIISIFCSCKSRGKIRWMFAHYFEGD